LKVFINPKLIIANYEEVYFQKPVRVWRGFLQKLPVTRRFWSQAWMLKANPFSWQTSGWPACIVQHEMDHLRGRLYTDIIVRSTFTCTCWEKVSRSGGRIYVPFSPKWQLLNVHFTLSD
jgi:peptide deformylase